jgi:hypothetical protein
VLHTDKGKLASRPEIARNPLTNLLIKIPWTRERSGVAGGARAAGARVREYEEVMLARAQEKAETAKNKDMFLSKNGGQAMAGMFKMFEEMAAAGGPPGG